MLRMQKLNESLRLFCFYNGKANMKSSHDNSILTIASLHQPYENINIISKIYQFSRNQPDDSISILKQLQSKNKDDRIDDIDIK